MFLRRKILERGMPGILSNGASVEFRDGLVMIETLAKSVDVDYAGMLDLSVCNSILLGELIKLRAPNCLVAATELPALVDFRFMLYRSLFQLLKHGAPYLETLTRLREELVRSITTEDQ
jgi:hypothetical protein